MVIFNSYVSLPGGTETWRGPSPARPSMLDVNRYVETVPALETVCPHPSWRRSQPAHACRGFSIYLCSTRRILEGIELLE